MRLLLTGGGLAKPVAESSALFRPTAIYPFPGGAGLARDAICGTASSPLCELGWKSRGVLELTALLTTYSPRAGCRRSARPPAT